MNISMSGIAIESASKWEKKVRSTRMPIAFAGNHEINTGELQFEWDHFEKSLQTEARFFSRAAETTLSSVFEGVNDHSATGEGKSVVIECGPGQAIAALYRARSFQNDAELVEAGGPGVRCGNRSAAKQESIGRKDERAWRGGILRRYKRGGRSRGSAPCGREQSLNRAV